MITESAAKKISGYSCQNIHEEKTRRAVEFLKLRANVHQHPHIEYDVHQAAVKENSHHQPPWLNEIDRHRVGHSETSKNVAVDAADSKQRKRSATTWRLKAVRAHRGEQADDVEQAAESEDSVSGWRGGGHELAERTAGGSHRKGEIRAALMAACGVGADQRAAGRAELRASLLSATEEAGHFFAIRSNLARARRRWHTLPCAIVSAFL